MSKYIDADKLIAEIDRRIEETKSMKPSFDQFWAGQISAFKGVKTIITSLQQEPRFPQYDKIVDKIFGAGNLEGWERDDAEMLVALAKEELLKSIQQEQPELPPIGCAETYYQRGLHNGIIKGQINILKGLEDIEKRKAEPVLVIKEHEQPEVDLEKAAQHVYESWMGGTMDDVRRDMVELGNVLNARKEK